MEALTSKIRDYINGPRLSYILVKDLARWNTLCSSLDVIGDTSLAIDAYATISKARGDSGSQNLALYGLLQALFLQQDATEHLCESLDVPFDLESFPRLKAIRDVRNDSIGHPTKRGTKAKTSQHFISRMSLTHSGFTMLSTGPPSVNTVKHIDVTALISYQREDIDQILCEVLRVLEKRAEDHRKMFENDKLSDAFPDTLGYAFEKLGESVRESKPRELGLWAIETIERSMSALRDGLARQDMGIDTFDSIRCLYDELEYALPELRKYLQYEVSDLGNQKIARIVYYFVCQKVRELREIVREIDDDDGD